nr:MAG TPA: hypothetical protein [Caudoviricetes sp.]
MKIFKALLLCRKRVCRLFVYRKIFRGYNKHDI